MSALGAVFLVFVSVTGGALAFMLVTSIYNAVAFPRLGAMGNGGFEDGRASSRGREAGRRPSSVSVLIPARDEAQRIGPTVRSLVDQRVSGVRCEFVVLDDRSSDGTAAVVREAADRDARLRVIGGKPLPDGWLGKSWACHQLAGTATGDVLVFTDADVEWSPGSLAAVVDGVTASRADLLTVWPTQRTVTWPERLVVPMMSLVVLAYLPVWLVHRTPWSAFAAGVGQCMVFRRAAYDAIGGHAAVRAQILEDVALARRVKAAGRRLRMADGAGWIRCRMYDGWTAVRDGYAKSIVSAYGGLAGLAAASAFHWLVFIGPWLWLLGGWVADGQHDGRWLDAPWVAGWPWLPAALILLGLIVRGITADISGQRVRDALWMPVSAVLMTIIAVWAVRWHLRGAARWKGRAIGSDPAGPPVGDDRTGVG